MMRSRQIQKILEYPEDPGVPEKHNRTSYSFKILNEKAYNPTEILEDPEVFRRSWSPRPPPVRLGFIQP